MVTITLLRLSNICGHGKENNKNNDWQWETGTNSMIYIIITLIINHPWKTQREEKWPVVSVQ